MQAVFREDVPVAIERDGIELRACSIGGDMSVAFMTLPAGADLAPAMSGLPEGIWQCAHWGYLLRGALKVTTREGVEVYEAGQAFYLAPDQAPEAVEDCEYMGFSPSDDLFALPTHVKSQGRPLGGPPPRVHNNRR